MSERYWSRRAVEDDVDDTWGARVRVDDDPEVGVIIKLTNLNHTSLEPDVILTEPDLRRVIEMIEYVKAGRSDEAVTA